MCKRVCMYARACVCACVCMLKCARLHALMPLLRGGPAGAVVKQAGIEFESFGAADIAALPDGDLIFADTTGRRILRLRDSVFDEVLPALGLAFTSALRFDAGRLFVLQRDEARLQTFRYE
jgi:hypothetical protein